MRSWVCLLFLMACTPRAERGWARFAAGVQAAPAPDDRGELCADLGPHRICWSGSQRLVLPRPLPDGPQPPAGFRCSGMGASRVCEERAREGGSFQCVEQRCVQAWPRMPDDSEWDCVEMNGVVFCHSRAHTAGVADGPLDLGWLCGPRRGNSPPERVCVDLDPDRPDLAREWQCRYEFAHGQPQRVCVPAVEPMIGSACSATRACPAASRCSDGVCLPARPEPGCWYDRDCGAGAACRRGTCEPVTP